VMHYKTIGQGCLIGLGASIIDDCPDGSTFLGPAATNTE